MLVYASIALLGSLLPAFFFLLRHYQITIDFGFYTIDSNATIKIQTSWDFFNPSCWFSAFEVSNALCKENIEV
jgi:hypothetical protein